MHAIRSVVATTVILLSGCISEPVASTANQEHRVASVVSKCAMEIFEGSYDDWQARVTDRFSAEELAILSTETQAVSVMIDFQLGRGHSIWGEKLAGHFRMTNMLPHLRSCLFIPQRCYGWEGPDYSKLESYLQDDQYLYGTVCVAAIEDIVGTPLHDAIHPTQEELDSLTRYATNPQSEFFHWALWMQRKLRIPERTLPGIEER